MTVEYPGGDNADLFASPADWISPNDDGGYKDNPPPADGSKVVISDTDHLWGIGGNREWVWKTFTRGHNLIYMDCYNTIFCSEFGLDPNDPIIVSLRRNMGYTLTYAKRMNLVNMMPYGELASSGYALANPATSGAEYLVYLPEDRRIDTLLKKIGVEIWDRINPILQIIGVPGNSVTVDLSGASGELLVEWFNPNIGVIIDGGNTNGGAIRSFTAPFRGDAVLYIHTSRSVPTTPTTAP
jgi:hypothetical protein